MGNLIVVALSRPDQVQDSSGLRCAFSSRGGWIAPQSDLDGFMTSGAIQNVPTLVAKAAQSPSRILNLIILALNTNSIVSLDRRSTRQERLETFITRRFV